MTSFWDIAINGAGGFGITFLFSYLINLIHAPVVLDWSRASGSES